jgi:predicted dehydrogenase
VRMETGGLVVVGCGWIAQRHAAAARRLRRPLIFASRDVDRARRYAKTFGGLAAYGSYAEALADPRAAGAIICTPHDRHLADARAALQAGKHVLLEKPLARTLDEADEIIAAADAAGRALMVAEQFHFMPAFRRVKAVLDSGRLGALRELHLIARGFGARSGWRSAADAVGGGALIDGGIHYVHNLRWWGGEVQRVVALRPPQTVVTMEGEDAVSLLAELAGGAIGLLSNSLGAPGLSRLQWSTVTGTRGSCFADNRGRFVVVRGEGGARLWLFRRDVRGYEAMLTAFHQAMVRGRPVEMDAAAGRADVAVVLAAYRSIAERRAVDLDGVGLARC